MNCISLVLLYEANRNIIVKVKSANGLSAENHLEEIVLQGDTWAPLMASSPFDKFGKSLLEKSPDYVYTFKGHVPVGILGIIDDVVGVSESGVKAKQLNAYLNVNVQKRNYSLVMINGTH